MYLVINLGLKSLRGIIFDRFGRQIYSEAYPVHTLLFDTFVEQDANEWLLLLDKIMLKIKAHKDLTRQILYVSVTTSSSCLLGVDLLGNVLTKVLMVSDKRSFREVEQIYNSKDYVSLNNKPICNSSSSVPKVLWVKNNDLDLFNRVKYWLGAGEFLNYFFTDNFFTDSLNAGKCFFNGSSYEIDLLDSLGIDSKTFPEVKEIGYTLPLSKKIKSKYNLNSNVQFILTTYDAICAVIGSSDGKKTTASDVSGTVTSVRILTDFTPQGNLINNPTLLTQHINVINKTLVGSSNNLGGGIIEWYKQAFFNNTINDVYSQMEYQANCSSVGAGGVFFLPYLLGERAPFFDMDAKGTFFGIDRKCNQNDFTRAVFESAAFVTRDLLDSLRHNGFPIKALTVSGGLARFQLINQLKADICNVPVHVIENFESTSIGAVILMALFSKEFSSYEEASSNIISVRKVIIPNKVNLDFYSNSFNFFKNLNEQLGPSYKFHKLLNNTKPRLELETKQNL